MSTPSPDPWRIIARKMFRQGMRTQAIAARIRKPLDQVTATCRGEAFGCERPGRRVEMDDPLKEFGV